MIKDGSITENGTFKQLMKNKGHLSQLIGEHVQLIEENEPEPETDQQQQASYQRSQSVVSVGSVLNNPNLNSNQLNNRRFT